MFVYLIFATTLPSHDLCSFRVPQTHLGSERYRERNRKAEQKRRIKKKTEEKEAVQCAFEAGCLARVSVMTRQGVVRSTTGTPFLEPVIWNLLREGCSGPLSYARPTGEPCEEREREMKERGERREGTITEAPLPHGRKAPPFIFSRDNAVNSREIHPAITKVKRSQEATMTEGVVDAPVRQWGHYKTWGTTISRKVAPTNIYSPLAGGEHLTRLTQVAPAFVISRKTRFICNIANKQNLKVDEL